MEETEKLTIKQERFCNLSFEGKTQRQAYIEAFGQGNMKDETIDNKAHHLAKQPKIKARMQGLFDEHRKKSLWTKEQAVMDLIWLKEESKRVIQLQGIKQATANAFINTIKELNMIEGLYAHQQKEEDTQERDVAKELRGLIDGIKRKAN